MCGTYGGDSSWRRRHPGAGRRAAGAHDQAVPALGGPPAVGDTGGPAGHRRGVAAADRAARAARGDRLPRVAVAHAARLLQLAGVQHRADQDFPRSRRRAGRGQRLQAGAGRKIHRRRLGSAGSGGTARAVGETAQRASYRRRAGWVRCQFRRVFWTSPRDRDRYVGACRRGASRIEADMRIGVPREVKNHEYRVAITPAGVHELAREGHEVFVETSAGAGSSLPDEEFTAAGAKVLKTADDVWGTADLVLKVKEPVPEEYHRMRQGQVLFTYLHLAASRECTDALLSHGVTAIAYETVQLRDGSLPLLAPMSEVAGRMAPQVGAHHLQRDGGGVLMGGVSGVYAAKVVVLGAGVSGMNAAAIALGMQAEVLLLDKNVARLRAADAIYQGHLQTVTSNSYEVERAVIDADLVIGAVLVPGAKAPRLVSHKLVTRMKQGSVLVDISIDQGGCFEDSRPTTHAEPTYRVADSVFYCVANMPGAVPHTSTYALTNVTLPYTVEIANRGWRDALRADPALGLGLNTYDGTVTCLPVAETHDLPYTPVADVLGS